MKKTVFLIIISTFFILSGLLVADEPISPFTISVHSDSSMFDDNDHVMVKVQIKNVSDKLQSFLFYDYDYSTLQPVVYDMTGREALTTVPYRLSGYTVDKMIMKETPRLISLKPDEAFVKELNLADYYELNLDKKYQVRLLFLPDALRRRALGSDNRYYFTIKENKYTETADTTLVASQNGNTTIRPSEVVQLFLSAEKDERWNDYLKYIDASQYIYSYPDYARDYLSSSKPVQQKVIEDFLESLVRPRPDNLLDFSIENETVTGNRAQVVAVAKRAAAGYPFIYTYTYSLEKKNIIWKVTGVEATVSRKHFK